MRDADAEYLFLSPEQLAKGEVIEQLGHPPVIALTATAAEPVRQDIAERLGLRRCHQVIASFDRPNLRLTVERAPDDEAKRDAVISRARALTADPASRCGLLYVASRKDAERYAGELDALGVRVAAYHAGMKRDDREQVHETTSRGCSAAGHREARRSGRARVRQGTGLSRQTTDARGEPAGTSRCGGHH